jgi:hypothetical protein
MKKLLVVLFALGAMSVIVAGCAPAAETTPPADANAKGADAGADAEK